MYLREEVGRDRARSVDIIFLITLPVDLVNTTYPLLIY